MPHYTTFGGYPNPDPHYISPEEEERLSERESTQEWPDPTPEMLSDPAFERVWRAIKGWDIGVPGAYSGYCGATGNHVRAILDALST